jgi:DNA-binding protein HU-beta
MSDTEKPKALTQAQIKQKVADDTGLTSKQVGEVLAALTNVTVSELNRVGQFTLLGSVKLTVSDKPATEERTMFSHMLKKDIVVKAKPASKTVKSRVLKDLSDKVV